LQAYAPVKDAKRNPESVQELLLPVIDGSISPDLLSIMRHFCVSRFFHNFIDNLAC